MEEAEVDHGICASPLCQGCVSAKGSKAAEIHILSKEENRKIS